MKRDPVCRMAVREEEAVTADYDGTIYHFCSEGCRDKFLQGHPRSRPGRSYELIIVGGGPAGMTAAVYAATLKIDAFVIARDLGRQAIDSTKISNSGPPQTTSEEGSASPFLLGVLPHGRM